MAAPLFTVWLGRALGEVPMPDGPSVLIGCSAMVRRAVLVVITPRLCECLSVALGSRMLTLDLVVQPFVLYRDSQTLGACVADGQATTGNMVSSDRCARFSGAYLEELESGRLLAILNHGVGVPGPRVLAAHLFALSTRAEAPSSGFAAPGIGLWDIGTRTALAHLTLYADQTRNAGGYVVGLGIDPAKRRVYALADFGQAGLLRLFVWKV